MFVFAVRVSVYNIITVKLRSDKLQLFICFASHFSAKLRVLVNLNFEELDFFSHPFGVRINESTGHL